MNAIPSRTVRIQLLIALLLKAAMVVMLIGGPTGTGTYGRWCSELGDTGSYLEPAEHLITQGTYVPDYRMPGYALPYIICRLFVPKDHAGDLLLILQTVLDALSTVALGLLAFRFTGSRMVSRGVFWCGVIGHTITQFDITLLTESFTSSAIILAAWSAARSFDRGTRWHALLAGALIAWAVFMRPVMVVAIPAFLVWSYLAIPHRGRMVRTMVMLGLPFALVDAAWVIRNATVHQRFIPANPSLHYASIDEGPLGPIIAFVEAFGGRTTWWDPVAEIRFFGVDGGVQPGQRTALPTETSTPGCTMDSLHQVADDMFRWRHLPASDPTRDALCASIRERMTRYRACYIEAHPWRYRLLAPMRCTRSFLFHSGTENVFGRPWTVLSLPERALKAGWSVLFHLIQSVGLIACVFTLALRGMRQRYGLLAAFTLLGVLIHPVAFRMAEHRYLAPVFPWLIVMAWIGVWHLNAKRTVHGADR